MRIYGKKVDVPIDIPVDWISVKHSAHGAVGDGSTDDTTAIQAAATAAACKTLFFPNTPGNKYIITSKITIPHSTNVIMDGCRMEYRGSANSTALKIGSNTTSTYSRVFRIKIRRQSRVWNNADNIGAEFINMRHCDIGLNEAVNFTTGYRLVADGAGFVYNKIDLDGYMAKNVTGLELISTNNGWASDNVFIGGGFQAGAGLTADENATSRYGIRIYNDTSVYKNENNIFISPSFELGASYITGATKAIPMLLDNTVETQVYGARHENCSDTFAKLTGNSSNNFFQVSAVFGNLPVGESLLDETGCDYTGNYLTRMDLLPHDKAIPVFLSGRLVDKACYYDGNVSMHVAKMHCIERDNNATYAARSGISINGDFLRITGQDGIGIFVDTTEQKKFILSVPSEDQPKGGVVVRCYDENGIILTSAGKGHPYVKGNDTSRSAFSYTSRYGGTYNQSFLSGEDTRFFSLGSAVKKIVVGFVKNANNSSLKSFNFFSVGGQEVHAWSGYEEIVAGQNIGTCAPTAGTWPTGKIVWNAEPVNAASVSGWRCYSGGTPGLWGGF